MMQKVIMLLLRTSIAMCNLSADAFVLQLSDESHVADAELQIALDDADQLLVKVHVTRHTSRVTRHTSHVTGASHHAAPR